ncbi:MAG: RNA polymerase sigma factor, partial [Planctomycetota bacterium]
MSPSSESRLEELLAQSTWLEGLALRLLGDPSEAEDLAQSTQLAALERPPPGPMQRGWLATVMRNLQKQKVRGDVRRREREILAARSETLPSPEAMVAKAEAQRLVVDAVLQLQEPYQSVILWRYFEDCPPREIARSRGIPLATVNSQIRRALQILRGRLQQEFGDSDSRAWIAALMPLLPREYLP